MTGEPRRREIFTNPFFVVTLGASVVFVLTVLAYLVSPYVLQRAQARGARGQGSVALAIWLDQKAPLALALEFIVMLVAGVVAMATDPLFTARYKSRRERESRSVEPDDSRRRLTH
jgi:hypothetical protein